MESIYLTIFYNKKITGWNNSFYLPQESIDEASKTISKMGGGNMVQPGLNNRALVAIHWREEMNNLVPVWWVNSLKKPIIWRLSEDFLIEKKSMVQGE